MIIVDAGGGTVDVSSYHFLSTAPITVEEVTSPECEWSLSFRDTVVSSFSVLTKTACRHPPGLDAGERPSARIPERCERWHWQASCRARDANPESIDQATSRLRALGTRKTSS